MRDFKGMKRQRGRNRGAIGKPQQHNANRAVESNGPEGVKVRGSAQIVYEKYQQLARDAGSAGDRVLAENFLQHAEHYFRLIRAMHPNRPASEIIGRDQLNSGFDVDFEDESGEGLEVETVETEAESRDRGGWRDRPRDRDDRPRDERPRDERPREDRYRDDRPRDERPREDRPRDDRPRDDRPRDDRPREERPRDDRPRDERPREERPRTDRPEGGRRDRWRDRDDRPERPKEDRPERDPMAVIEPSGGAITGGEDREPSPTLRSEDGAESHAPDFLRPRRPRVEAEVEEPRPARRRRVPRSFEGGEGQDGEG